VKFFYSSESAARELGISRRTLLRQMERHGIEPLEFEGYAYSRHFWTAAQLQRLCELRAKSKLSYKKALHFEAPNLDSSLRFRSHDGVRPRSVKDDATTMEALLPATSAPLAQPESAIPGSAN
jgi:hypothetical protein